MTDNRQEEVTGAEEISAATDNDDAVNSAPPGLYILSAFYLLGVAALIYYAMTLPGYWFAAVIYGPFLLYAGVGLVPRWPGARILAIVLASLTLALAILDIVAVFALDMANKLSSADVLTIVIQDGLRIMILPFVLIFLLGRQVKAYYAEST